MNSTAKQIRNLSTVGLVLALALGATPVQSAKLGDFFQGSIVPAELVEWKLGPLANETTSIGEKTASGQKRVSEEAKILSFSLSTTPGGPPAAVVYGGQILYGTVQFYHPGGLVVNAMAPIVFSPAPPVDGGGGGGGGGWAVALDSLPPGYYYAQAAFRMFTFPLCVPGVGVNIHYDVEGLLVGSSQPFSLCP